MECTPQWRMQFRRTILPWKLPQSQRGNLHKKLPFKRDECVMNQRIYFTLPICIFNRSLFWQCADDSNGLIVVIDNQVILLADVGYNKINLILSPIRVHADGLTCKARRLLGCLIKTHFNVNVASIALNIMQKSMYNSNNGWRRSAKHHQSLPKLRVLKWKCGVLGIHEVHILEEHQSKWENPLDLVRCERVCAAIKTATECISVLKMATKYVMTQCNFGMA